MPPSFAGTNALYSREFYTLAKENLGSDGTIAQWLPFHLISPYDSKSISKTFQSVFPNSILWLDPLSNTGILLGSKNEQVKLGAYWPGYDTHNPAHDLSKKEVLDDVILDREALLDYAKDGVIITDNNQYLSYGESTHTVRNSTIRGENHDILKIKKD